MLKYLFPTLSIILIGSIFGSIIPYSSKNNSIPGPDLCLFPKSAISISSFSLMKYASAIGNYLQDHILLRQKFRCFLQWTLINTTSSLEQIKMINFLLFVFCTLHCKFFIKVFT